MPSNPRPWKPFRLRLEEEPLEARLQNLENGQLQLRNAPPADTTNTLVPNQLPGPATDPGGGSGGSSGGSQFIVQDTVPDDPVIGVATLQFGAGFQVLPDADDSTQANVTRLIQHLLNSTDFDDVLPASPTSQDLIYANTTPAWTRFGKGTDGTYLGVSGGLLAWGTPAGTPHPLLDGSIDSDTVAASPVKGDLVYGNATPLWDRLPVGSTGQFLGVSGGVPAWGTPAGTGATKAPLPGWIDPTISTAPTSFTAMQRYGTGGGGIKVGVPMQGAGVIVGLSVILENALNGGGGTETYEVEIYLDGLSTGISITLTDGQTSAVASGSFSYANGNILSIYEKRTGTISSSGGAEASAWIKPS